MSSAHLRCGGEVGGACVLSWQMNDALSANES